MALMGVAGMDPAYSSLNSLRHAAALDINFCIDGYMFPCACVFRLGESRHYCWSWSWRNFPCDSFICFFLVLVLLRGILMGRPVKRR